jgi:hypothetical protein
VGQKSKLLTTVITFVLAVTLISSCAQPAGSPNPTPAHTSSVTSSPASTPTPTSEAHAIVVTSPADSGSGTLRQALLSAHSGETITFDPAVFPPKAPVTIALSSGLPPITQGNLTIDASNAGVVLDGAKIQGASTNGLTVTSNGNNIRGLQVIRFSLDGIALQGDIRNNIIGGDQKTGTGPLGQGNLVSGNKGNGILIGGGASHNTVVGNYVGTNLKGTLDWGNICGITLNNASYNQITGNLVSGNDPGYGIQLFSNTTHHNTISGNRIGSDASGEHPLSNKSAGISIHDGANHNIVGPDNVVAYNNDLGISVRNQESLYNTITRNSIHDNTGPGIGLLDGGNKDLESPFFDFFEFDMGTGAATGWADANCTVEFFSESGDEGEIYEGQTKADSLGAFTFHKGTSLAGPVLTATATTADGDTSKFSPPVSGVRKIANLQEGNSVLRTRLPPKRSKELADNRIGNGMGNLWAAGEGAITQILNELTSLGIKRITWGLNEGEQSAPLGGGVSININWTKSEFYIPPDPGGPDDFVTGLTDNGIISYLPLSFWDKANHPDGWQPQPGFSRFSTEEDIQRYLEYVRFIVSHFKGRIQYYEIWNEPDMGGPLQHIEIADYINLVKRTVPVIRQEDPEAKIVVGSIVLQDNPSRDYLFSILNSDIMPLVDVVSWHPMFGVSPEYLCEYYHNYPSLVQEIKDVASANGFRGEYRGDAIVYRSPDCPWCFPGDPLYSNTVAAKYYARGIVIHLGMDLATIPGVLASRVESFATIRNLCTLMAGTNPTSLSLEIQSTATNIRTYGFSLPDGSHLIALWTDGVAVDDDPGIKATVTIQNISAQKVTGIDVLNSFEQPLNFNVEGGNLIINDLLIRDYPIFIRLSD